MLNSLAVFNESMKNETQFWKMVTFPSVNLAYKFEFTLLT